MNHVHLSESVDIMIKGKTRILSLYSTVNIYIYLYMYIYIQHHRSTCILCSWAWCHRCIYMYV